MSTLALRDKEPRFRDCLLADFPSLSALQLDQLEQHYNLLLKWNSRMNLTRVVAPDEAARIHYAESLLLACVLPPGPLRVADIGSGAGFPGMAIAVFRPDCTVDLVESDQRKAVFLREATRDLENVRVIASRAEELSHKYDWLVSRAIAPSVVLDLCLAPSAAILMAEGDASAANHIIRVPHSTQRVIGLFHVEQLGAHDKI
jgi:16S rRNA (guanine(527)-N(7))-methyltransferase RsmG